VRIGGLGVEGNLVSVVFWKVGGIAEVSRVVKKSFSFLLRASTPNQITCKKAFVDLLAVMDSMWVAVGRTDMLKGFDLLTASVQERMAQDPFCGQPRTAIRGSGSV
jgi:hypothetical protein